MGTYSYYAGGKWLEPVSGEFFETENPYTGEAWAQIPRCNDKDVDIAVQAAYYFNNYFDACTRLPVGDFKRSGYSRENGWEGMRDFLQTKSVWLSTAREIPPPF